MRSRARRDAALQMSAMRERPRLVASAIRAARKARSSAGGSPVETCPNREVKPVQRSTCDRTSVMRVTGMMPRATGCEPPDVALGQVGPSGALRILGEAQPIAREQRRVAARHPVRDVEERGVEPGGALLKPDVDIRHRDVRHDRGGGDGAGDQQRVERAVQARGRHPHVAGRERGRQRGVGRQLPGGPVDPSIPEEVLVPASPDVGCRHIRGQRRAPVAAERDEDRHRRAQGLGGGPPIEGEGGDEARPGAFERGVLGGDLTQRVAAPWPRRASQEGSAPPGGVGGHGRGR